MGYTKILDGIMVKLYNVTAVKNCKMLEYSVR